LTTFKGGLGDTGHQAITGGKMYSAAGRVRFRTRPSVGVVGLGYWGPNLLRVLIERTDVKVRWICDRDEARLEALQRRYPSVCSTASIEELLDDPMLDAVILATPVHTHYDLALRAMEVGKHVFVEKPLATSGTQAVELIDYATQQGLVLMCGHTFLYSPPVRAVKSLIDSGELGDLYFISSSRVNLGLHQRDVSVIWDLGPHDFSILLYWLGAPPRSIRAAGRDSIVLGVSDVAFVTMEFDSGVIANVELSWLAPSKLRRTVVVGSRKMVVYEDGSTEPIRIFDRGIDYKDPDNFGEWHLSYRSGDILSPHIPSHEPLSRQTDDFVTAISGGEPECDQAIALDVVRCAEAAEMSLDTGGMQVSLAGESLSISA
jgi:predicted dehydrogenase